MTLSLPDELRPWAGALQLFPPETALPLGQLVRRLSLALGALPSPALAGMQDPEGYEGLANRGAWHRLVPGELLWAEELPDEFERRAAMNELLFFKLKQVEQRGSLTSVVLFDAGPEQMGEPRLAHLALLIVLERRARAAGAGFQWGTLQEWGLHECDAIVVNTVLELLASRTPRLADESSLEKWARLLGSFKGMLEVWVIGREAHQLPGLTPNTLAITELITAKTRELHLSAVSERRNWTLELDLPGDGVCAHLIRDPFASERTPATTRIAGIAGAQHGCPYLLSGESFMAIRMADGGVIWKRLHTHAQRRQSFSDEINWRQTPPNGERFGAVNLHGNRRWSITQTPDFITLNNLPHLQGNAALRVANAFFKGEEPGPLRIAYLMRVHAEHMRVFFIDDYNRLVRVNVLSTSNGKAVGKLSWEVIEHDVIFLMPLRKHLFFARRSDPEGIRFGAIWADTMVVPPGGLLSSEAHGNLQLFPSKSSGGTLGSCIIVRGAGVAAEACILRLMGRNNYEKNGTIKTEATPFAPLRCDRNATEEIVGALHIDAKEHPLSGKVAPPLNSNDIFYLLRSSDRKTLRLAGGALDLRVPEQPSPILYVDLIAARGIVVFATAEAICIYSFPRQEFTLKVDLKDIK